MSKSDTVKLKITDKLMVVITDFDNLSITNATLIVGRPARQLKAIVTKNQETISDATVTWKVVTEDGKAVTGTPTVIKLENGAVTGLKPGTATIQASYTDPDTHETTDSREVMITVTNPSGTTDPEDPDTPENPDEDDEDTILIYAGSETVVCEPNRTVNIRMATDPAGKTVRWDSSNKTVATVGTGASGTATGIVSGLTAGSTTITARVGKGESDLQKKTVTVEVSGFTISGGEETRTVMIGQKMTLPAITAYGAAKNTAVVWTSSDDYIARVTGSELSGREVGQAVLTVTVGKYKKTINVIVTDDPSTTINAGTIKITDTLPFSTLSGSFASQVGGRLQYVTGLSVPAEQGTLYYKYVSSTSSGQGVGQGESFYLSPGSGQKALSDVTFVPNASFAGGQATITYNGITADDQKFTCHILVTVTKDEGSNAGIELTTSYNTPVKLSGSEFNRVSQERIGEKLDYVIFSQPPAWQGTLYTNYVDSGNYGSVADMSAHFTQKAIDDLWFVPAPGYTGTVTLYYTAFGLGGNSYAGQVNIRVNAESGVEMSGLSYVVLSGGVARFDDYHFNRYCREVLRENYWVEQQSLSFIRFDSLPSESQGILYSGYSSSSNPGSRALTGTDYYYGTRSPRIDQLAFVPAEGFVGTVSIPFTGYTLDGTRFSGTVDVNVRGGGVAVGDILYVCAPGRSVSFNDTHFNSLCRDVTGSALNYISIQSLPSSSAGTLYYNNSRASTSTNYRNGTSTPRIDNLSFTASRSFSGTVDIPFTGRATNGTTFRGVVTISSSSVSGTTTSAASTGAGSGASLTVFTDLAGYSDYQRSAVDFLYEHNITHGLTPTQYGPQSSIRRGDFALMLYTAFSFAPTGTTQAFADVPSTAYYAQAVNTLYSRGVVSGIGGGLYDPDNTLTREDAVCMVQRALRASGRTAYDGSAAVLYSYGDGTAVSGYAQGAVAFAVQNGYLPLNGGWITPTMPLTRIDMAEILYRVLG